MDQLSSCYFCGGALDVSLSEYPIIPKSLDPEAQKQGTVVLCSTCREKLATIVEPAVEAAKADARETAGTVTDTGTAGQSEPSEASGTPTTVESTPTDSVVEPTNDGSLLGSDTPTANNRTTSGQSEEPAESPPEPDATEAAETNAQDGRAEQAGDPETGSEDTGGNATSDSNDTDPSLTKLEYNKVMRLLQNREMPVDRVEIREVAVNAYDIEGEQFDAIIDAAVDRDLIGQENGQLVEADG